MNEKQQRNASLDLLKCICMLLIISHHYVVHGGYDPLNLENFSKGRFFLQQVGMYGSLSCDIFALITGYYLINERGNVQKRFCKVIRLFLEMLFYSISIYAIMVLTRLVPLSITGIYKALLPNLWGNWYVIAYLLFYLFVPFLNPILLNLSKQKYKWFIVLLLFCWSVVPTFTYLDPAWSWSNVDFFIVMYTIGAYFRLHVKEKVYVRENILNRKDLSLVCGILSIILLGGSICFIDFVGIKLGRVEILSQGTYFMPLYSVLAVFCAISWFSYFSTVEFKSSMISFVSGTTLGIYLIHENDYIRIWVWQMIYPNVNYVNSPYVHFVVKVVLIFVICCIIEAVRLKTFAKIDKHIEKILWNKIGVKISRYFQLDNI